MSKPSWKCFRHKETGHYYNGYINGWPHMDGGVTYTINGPVEREKKYEAVEPFEFYDEMEYLNFGKGRSSISFYFKGLNQEWHTTAKGLHDMIPFMKDGKIKGIFGFQKQGTELSIKLIESK